MMKTTAKTITPFFNVYICNLLLSCFVGIVFWYSNLFLKNEKRFEYYKNVRNLNFEEFIRYFPDSGQATEAEFEALKKLDDWPFKQVARMEDMPVPIHRHTISSINEVLTRWGGITTSNLGTSGVCYLEEYDAYYTYTSDFNMFYFIAESGEQVGNYVYLRKSVENGNIAVLTLRLMPGTDEWQIVSHWRSGS